MVGRRARQIPVGSTPLGATNRVPRRVIDEGALQTPMLPLEQVLPDSNLQGYFEDSMGNLVGIDQEGRRRMISEDDAAALDARFALAPTIRIGEGTVQGEPMRFQQPTESTARPFSNFGPIREYAAQSADMQRRMDQDRVQPGETQTQRDTRLANQRTQRSSTMATRETRELAEAQGFRGRAAEIMGRELDRTRAIEDAERRIASGQREASAELQQLSADQTRLNMELAQAAAERAGRQEVADAIMNAENIRRQDAQMISNTTRELRQFIGTEAFFQFDKEAQDQILLKYGQVLLAQAENVAGLSDQRARQLVDFVLNNMDDPRTAQVVDSILVE